MLLGVMWFALILAVCIKYQHAASRQREQFDRLKTAGLLPVSLVPRPRPQQGPATGSSSSASGAQASKPVRAASIQ
jgi:hypothetical protein